MDEKRESIKEKSSLTSYEELVAEFRTCIVETSSGKKFEIQNVSPGELMLFAGSPLVQKLTQAGVNIEDKASVTDHIQGWSSEEQVATATDPNFVNMVRTAVCAGVISVNFVDKPKKECDKAFREVSLDFLTLPEIFQLFTAIMMLSSSDKEVMDFYTFREESEGVQGDNSENISDGGKVQAEAISDIVS